MLSHGGILGALRALCGPFVGPLRAHSGDNEGDSDLQPYHISLLSAQGFEPTSLQPRFYYNNQSFQLKGRGTPVSKVESSKIWIWLWKKERKNRKDI